LELIKLKLPVLFKLKEGNRAKYAHIFIMVNTGKGLEEALNFEGFKNAHLQI